MILEQARRKVAHWDDLLGDAKDRAVEHEMSCSDCRARAKSDPPRVPA